MNLPNLNIYDIYYIVHLSDKVYETHPIKKTNLKSIFCAKLVNFGQGKFYFEREEGGMIIIDYKLVDFMAPSREHCAPGGLVS